jgi:putative transposase
MTSRAVLRRVNRSGVDWHFIAPGKPQQNASVAMIACDTIGRLRDGQGPEHRQARVARQRCR